MSVLCSICLLWEAPDTTCVQYPPLSLRLRVLFAGIWTGDGCIGSGSEDTYCSATEECRFKTGELPSFCFSLSVFVLLSLLCHSVALLLSPSNPPTSPSNPSAGGNCTSVCLSVPTPAAISSFNRLQKFGLAFETRLFRPTFPSLCCGQCDTFHHISDEPLLP